MKMVRQKKRIKKAIALCGFIWLGGSLPGVAQLPRFEDARSPAPKPVSEPAPQPRAQQQPPAPKPPAPKPPEPVSDAVPIQVPTPEPVSPPSDAIPIEVPVPQPVSPPPTTTPPPRPMPPSRPLPPTNNTTPPLPEQVQDTVATLTPVNGLVSVKLINRTLATINYEIIGDTTLRTLPGKSEVTLRELPTPTNVTFRRTDGGFLLIQATVNEEGILELNMRETNVFDFDRTTLSIEENGSAFLN
jgi:hypothetical protein